MLHGCSRTRRSWPHRRSAPSRTVAGDKYLLGAWCGRYAVSIAQACDRVNFDKGMLFTLKEMRDASTLVMQFLGTGCDLLAPLTEFKVQLSVYVETGRMEMVKRCPGADCVYYKALTPFGLAGRHGSGIPSGPFWLWREEGKEGGTGVTDEVALPVVQRPQRL
ncbi:hypothetical protein BDK51DRAFT_34480 [Blyttiomyces helicus]|uniref:Uncharacterized protein n=1 Tax=Blyttiomyces helicus TaxID=388810 RepID=A0A4P9W0C3_9FUNG|nr:hypothetical protein BDK51DRAFT_34480 [Blyttiomyces helicus]|eukprot:RKO85524.1 hypothetical protein BDK51DRAFT_34480 [Blyttiomyces helicus]